MKIRITAILALSLAVLGCDSCDRQNPLSPSSTGGSMNHHFQEVWITPNEASRDMIDMFTKPELWPDALKNTTVFKFYASQLQSGGACRLCGPNTLEAFQNARAVNLLNQHGIKIAMEADSLKPHNCNHIESAIDGASQAISGIRSMGGELSYLTMDEPFTSGLPNQNGAVFDTCNFSLNQVTEKVKSFVLGVRGISPITQVGLIEAYPYNSADQIESYLDALEAAGVKMPFLHLDFDPNYSGLEFQNDLSKLRNYCRANGIAFGVIIVGGDGMSNESASAGAMLQARRIDETIGLGNQDHLLLQSWLDYPPTRGRIDQRLYPDNLPESNQSTLTGSLNAILEMIR
jgi:hypothetical protein